MISTLDKEKWYFLYCSNLLFHITATLNFQEGIFHASIRFCEIVYTLYMQNYCKPRIFFHEVQRNLLLKKTKIIIFFLF